MRLKWNGTRDVRQFACSWETRYTSESCGYSCGGGPQKPLVCRTAEGGGTALATEPATRRFAAGRGALRVGCDPEPRLFSNDRDHFAAVCHGERCFGRDRGGRQ